MTAHAILSPSGVSRWFECPGSLYLAKGEPDQSSEYAKEGTVAHEIAECCLITQTPASRYVGNVFSGVEVDEEMAEYIQVYIDTVTCIHASMSECIVFDVEQKLEFTQILDLSNDPELIRTNYEIQKAFGKADVVLLGDGELQIHDLKYGKGVRVNAENNKQLMIYALAAYYYYSLLCDIDKVSVHIHQPRLHHYSNFEITVEDLLAFGEVLKEKAAKAYLIYLNGSNDDKDFSPGEDQCRFCKAAGKCPYLARHSLETVANDFINLDEDISTQIEHAASNVEAPDNAQLANVFRSLDLVEAWCKAVRARTQSERQQGNPVPGFKLVNGRLGNRSWVSDVDAENTLKSFRLKQDEMYNKKFISPTQALKALKDNPKRVSKLETIIVRPEGKPTVVPETDKRPAINIANDFNDLTKEEVTHES